MRWDICELVGLAEYVLGRADDALVLGHRLSEWVGQAPMLEEELALANIALDLIGQARLLYQYAARLIGGVSEDDLAYGRDAGAFRNLLLVEQPNGDFAQTMVRQVLYSAFAALYWRAMMGSADAELAAIAGKAVTETEYHRRHAEAWLVRLGDGTEESHARAQVALERLWPFAGEMFSADSVVDAAGLMAAWDQAVSGVLEQARLRRPETPWYQRGGREGRHSEHLGRMLAEMQVLPRSYPGAVW